MASDQYYTSPQNHNSYLPARLDNSAAVSTPELEPTVMYAVCRFEVPLMSYPDPSLAMFNRFTLDEGPPVLWKFTLTDLAQRQWITIIGTFTDLEKAKLMVREDAKIWSDEAAYHARKAEDKYEYRLFASEEKNEVDFRRKVYIDGPIQVRG